MNVIEFREKMLMIRSEDDIYTAIYTAKNLLKSSGFSVSDHQKIMVAIAELTRNVIDHAGGRGVIVYRVMKNRFEIEVVDRGPGIPNYEQFLTVKPLKRKHATSGMGRGLFGVKKLMDELTIVTNKGGTKIIAVKKIE